MENNCGEERVVVKIRKKCPDRSNTEPRGDLEVRCFRGAVWICMASEEEKESARRKPTPFCHEKGERKKKKKENAGYLGKV